jgi:hypothetical protein
VRARRLDRAKGEMKRKHEKRGQAAEHAAALNAMALEEKQKEMALELKRAKVAAGEGVKALQLQLRVQAEEMTRLRQELATEQQMAKAAFAQAVAATAMRDDLNSF